MKKKICISLIIVIMLSMLHLGASRNVYATEYYEGFEKVGTIEIEKIGLNYPILVKATDAALEKSVAVMYPAENVETKVNQPGNVVIMGHNYKNGKFFSNLNKVAVGDEITMEASRRYD